MKKTVAFLNRLRSDASHSFIGRLYTVVVEVLFSARHLVRCALNPRRWLVRKGLHRELLTKLYRELLLRNPDAQGFARQLRLLNMDRLTPSQIEESMRKSLEFRSLVTPLSKEVECLYDRYMFRKPTLTELAYHTNIFRSQSDHLSDLVQAVQSAHVRSHLAVRPLTLEMDITNQCNLRCVMCYFSDERIYRRKRDDLSLADFSRIAEQLFPLCQEVGLSIGTEPLLHQEFSEMLAILPQYKVPHTFITTNGLLLREKVIAEMIRTNFSRVNISMDAATKQTYERIRVGSNFEKVVDNIRTINRLKEKAGSATPSISLVFVLMRSNIRELPAFVRMARDLNAVGVTAVHMVPYEMLNNKHESLSLDKGLCNQMLDEARSLAKSYGIAFAGPSNFPESQPVTIQVFENAPAATRKHTGELRFDPEAHRFQSNLGHAEADTLCCPFPWHFLGIDSSGNITPCGWWYGEKPMGNIKTQSFDDIWNSEQYRTLRSELMTRALRKACQQCPAAGMGRVEQDNAFRSRIL